MALDHPDSVERLAVFDVIPILEAWNRTDARFAQTYWPWILLSQKEPLPESYLLGAPKAVFDNPFGHGTFGSEILEEYASTYHEPARVHGICEEYRAAATIDVEHDRADKEASRGIECPMLHLWAEGGPLDTFYAKDGGPLGIWRQWAPSVHGQAMKGGLFSRKRIRTILRCSSSSFCPHKTVYADGPKPWSVVQLRYEHRQRGTYIVSTLEVTVIMSLFLERSITQA
jgi:haloacetate dehalogenase